MLFPLWSSLSCIALSRCFLHKCSSLFARSLLCTARMTAGAMAPLRAHALDGHVVVTVGLTPAKAHKVQEAIPEITCPGTGLHEAVAAGDLTKLQQLLGDLECAADVNAVDAAGRTPLALCTKGDELGTALIAAGAQRISPLHANFYPTHAAVMTGDVNHLAEMLQDGYSAQQGDYQGLTPLHAAVGIRSIVKVRMLLAAGANPTAASRYGLTAIELAEVLGAGEILPLLHEATKPDQERVIKPAVAPESSTALQGASGLTKTDVAAMQSAWALLTSQHQPCKSGAVVRDLSIMLFEMLFDRYPYMLEEFFPSFKKANGKVVTGRLEKHATQVLTTLGVVLSLLDDFPKLAEAATALVQRHVGYGVKLQHYDEVLGVVAEFISGALSADDLWDDLQASAWTKLIGLVKAVAAGAYKTPEEESA